MANRFQFALPEPRPRDGWFRVGNLDITTTALLVIAGVASMFVYAISKETFSKLIFDPLAVRDGELWRLFTWPIANPPSHIWLVLTLLFFWIIGHAVEAMVGRVRYTILIVVITVVPATIVTLLPPEDFPTIDEMGLGMLATALFVVFAVENPNMPFFFGVPAWIIATVFVGIDVLLWVGDRVWGTLVMMGSATLLALIMVRQWGYARRLTFIPKVGGATSKSPRRAPGPAARPRAPASRQAGQRGRGPLVGARPAPPHGRCRRRPGRARRAARQDLGDRPRLAEPRREAPAERALETSSLSQVRQFFPVATAWGGRSTGMSGGLQAFGEQGVSGRSRLDQVATLLSSPAMCPDAEEMLVIALRPDLDNRRIIASAGNSAVRASISVSIAAGNQRAWASVQVDEIADIAIASLPEIIRASVQPSGIQTIRVAAVHGAGTRDALVMWLTRSASFSDVAIARHATVMQNLSDAAAP